MRILIHGLNFSPEQVGIGKFTGELAADLVKKAFDVSVVTTPPYYPSWQISKGYSAYRYQTETINGASVVRCPLWVPKKVTGLKRVIHLASFGISSIPAVLRMALKRPHVVVVVQPTLFCLPAALLAAKLCGAKTWLHVQDFEVDAAFELGILKAKWLKKTILAVEAFLMRRFDRVSSITPRMVEQLWEKGVTHDRSRLFPNWVDCDAIFPMSNRMELKSQFNLPKDKFLALYAGNIGEKQGLEIIIDTARRLEHREDLHFALCGSGAAIKRLKEYADGVKNITWLDLQPIERLNELLNAADLHLLPQRSDVADLVMPSKLTGMLASGRPVLATAYPQTQLAEVLKERGVVVEPEDTNAFVAAIEALMLDRERCELYGQRARQFAIDSLGKERIIGRFIEEVKTL